MSGHVIAGKGALLVVACIIVSVLHGCGGGGGDSGGTPAASVTVSGVAATGAPMNGSAFMKDAANSPEMSTTIDPQTGRFSFNATGKTPPFMLRAGSLYSMSGGSGTANINPLTTLMVGEMGGFSNMSSLNGFYNHPDPGRMNSMFANMSTSRMHMRDKMRPLLDAYGAGDTDPMNGTFAIGQGMDRMFDDVKMSIDANGNVTMMYVNGSQVYNGPMGNMMGGTMNTGNIHQPGSATTSSVTISPSVARLRPGQTQQFTSNLAVSWSVVSTNGGTISSTGLYTAPATPGMYIIRATGISDTSQTRTATVMVGNSGMMM
ncbi:Ig-like domain-containing protein [Geomonas sp. RF6]|uniref:Ig-like domain-containing protein n=1 Tax=Geomonas sp. RF6 TaxID=2897342 RepID=UPI001E59F1F7|nr:Ig-like domain-containing protein [Geomonas sp. RF6]UFS72223.1 Ig-like domain-containing protein [Geomonas sp. RF6]